MSEPKQPEGPYAAGPEEDEIDLADLVAVLFRNRYLIILLTLLTGLAGLGYSFLQTEKYEVSTFLEIGQSPNNGGYQNIQSPEAVKNRLQSVAQSLARDFSGNGPDGQLQFSPENSLQIEAPENGNILRLRLEAPKGSAALPFLEELNRSLIQSHNRIFMRKTDRIENQVEQKRLSLERIDSKIGDTKRRFEVKKIQQRNKITRIQGQIDNLQTRKATLSEQLSLLEEERSDLEKRVSETQARYEKLSQSKSAADATASNDSAISLMLFSNEILRIQRHLEDLRNRYLFKIPEQRAQLQANLKELGTKIENQKANLREAKTQLNQLDAERETAIANLRSDKEAKRLQIDALNNQRENMIVTKVTGPPEFSEGKTAPNTKLNVALALVLGGFLSVFLAFLREFWRTNRKQIVQDTEANS